MGKEDIVSRHKVDGEDFKKLLAAVMEEEAAREKIYADVEAAKKRVEEELRVMIKKAAKEAKDAHAKLWDTVYKLGAFDDRKHYRLVRTFESLGYIFVDEVESEENSHTATQHIGHKMGQTREMHDDTNEAIDNLLESLD